MTRPSEVTYESVVVECLELWATGQSTSFNNVYDRLGRRGSAAIVQKFIAQWKKESADRLSAKRTLPDLPTDLVTASDALLGQTWAMALDQAEVAYSQAYQKLEDERSEAEAALRQAHERTVQAERGTLRLNGDLQGLRAELLAKDNALQDALHRLGEALIALATRDDQIVTRREDVARTLNTIESDRARHADELSSLRDRHALELVAERQRGEEKLAHAQAKYQLELGRVEEIAAGERQYRTQQIAEIRQAAKFSADALAEQLDSARAMAERHLQDACTARDDASTWRGRAEILQETVIAERSRAETAEQALQARSAVKTKGEAR